MYTLTILKMRKNKTNFHFRPIRLLVFVILCCQLISCTKDQMPDLKNVQSVNGDILIKNVPIVDPVNEKVETGMDILIRSGKIYDIQPTGTKEFKNVAIVIPGEEFYAMPGFVNTHTHLWQHLSRSVSPSSQLQEWIPKVYRPAFHMTDEEFFKLNYAACNDALLHGITSVIDWTINADEKKFEQVVKAMVAANIGGAITWTHTAVFLPAETQHREFRRIRTIAMENGLDLFVAHLPPERIPIPALYDGILLAKTEGVPIAEHIMENVQCQRDWLNIVTKYLEKHGDQLRHEDREMLQEITKMPAPPSIDAIAAMSQNARIVLGLINELPDGESSYNKDDIKFLKNMAEKNGPSYIPFLEHLGAYENGYVSIHSSLLSPEDIDIYKKHGVFINHNPESNAYLASGIAPISSFLQAGLSVTIGTDGAASNDRIDMLAAMRLMSHLQKEVALNVPLTKDMNSWGILRCATIEGAKAVRQKERIGTIEVGKEADIVLFRAESFEMQPVTEDPDCIANLLVNSAESRDIFCVIADGQIKVWDNKLVDDDEKSLAISVTEIRKNAMERGDKKNEGRKWIEQLEFNESTESIVRYRSIYANYIIDAKYTNTSEKDATVSVVISDSEKVGGLFYADETKTRFPYRSPSDTADQQVHQLNVELPPGATFSLKKELGGEPIIFIVSTDSGFEKTMEITLPYDPVWDWALRANVYVETRFITNK